jgi:mannitol-specific phosphotransferase system IIBC component
VSDKKEAVDEQNIQEKGFWSKNIISILLIVFLIVSGVYAFNRESSNEDRSVEEKVEEIKKEGEEENTDNEETKSADETTKEDEAPEIQKYGTKITVKANSGDGLTHLARKAIAEYIQDKDITLSKEQKIYTETNLKNKYYQHHLNLGQEVSFELQDLDEFIQKAQNLSDEEKRAWSRYNHLVPSL